MKKKKKRLERSGMLEILIPVGGCRLAYASVETFPD
jgi:hypothetical protein